MKEVRIFSKKFAGKENSRSKGPEAEKCLRPVWLEQREGEGDR